MDADLFQKMERALSALSEQCRSGTRLDDAVRCVDAQLQTVLPNVVCRVHVVRIRQNGSTDSVAETPDGVETLEWQAGDRPICGTVTTTNDLKSETPFIRTADELEKAAGFQSVLVARSPVSHAHQLMTHLYSPSPLPSDCLEFASFINEVLVPVAAGQLIGDFLSGETDLSRLAAFIRDVNASQNAGSACWSICQSGAAALQCERVHLLEQNGTAWQLLASTGVRDIIRTSDEAIRIQQLATELSSADQQSSLTGRNSGLSESLKTWLLERGVNSVRIQPLQVRSSADSRPMMMLLEARSAAVIPLRLLHSVADEAARILAKHRTGRSGHTWKRRAILAAIPFIALWIPVPFELPVEGRAFPRERRRIFAPEDGLVLQNHVDHGDRVTKDQVLLTLENHLLTQDLRKLQGEIGTLTAGLEAIRLTRNSTTRSGTTPVDGLVREEKQLEEKVRSVENEIRLVESRIAALTIHSPIPGSAFRHRVDESLQGRPVQRGQQLMEVVGTGGEWQLELRVPAGWTGYLATALDRSSASDPSTNGLTVRYQTADSQWSKSDGHLRSIDTAARIDQGQLVCIVHAEIARQESMRPGQSVRARIHCGYRSAGFVWFREIVEAIQRFLFIWT